MQTENGDKPIAATGIKISIVYDNRSSGERFEEAWGFSCLIEGAPETILFDTGGDGSVFGRNMKALGIDASAIDKVVLSHDHWDHTGGLGTFLEMNTEAGIIVPASFPSRFKDDLRDDGIDVIEVDDPYKICRGVYSTGELGNAIREQSLVIHTDRGLIVITGCAHPGIVRIVEKAAEIIDADVLFVMGGFHLLQSSKGRIEEIIARFKELGVRYAAPCHCSGDEAIDLFKAKYGDRFVDISAGLIISVEDLK